MFKVVVVNDATDACTYGGKVEYDGLFMEELVSLIMTSIKCGKAIVISPLEEKEEKCKCKKNGGNKIKMHDLIYFVFVPFCLGYFLSIWLYERGK